MEAQGIIMTIIIGAIAGWLAGLILKGRGMGFIVNSIVGIIGAFVGTYLFTLIGFSAGSGLLSAVFTSTAGAIVLLAIIGILKKSQ